MGQLSEYRFRVRLVKLLQLLSNLAVPVSLLCFTQCVIEVLLEKGMAKLVACLTPSFRQTPPPRSWTNPCRLSSSPANSPNAFP